MISEERTTHLAHRLFDVLVRNKAVAFLEPEGKILREIKHIIVNEMQTNSELDLRVRRRLASYSRKIVEGSREWDILYRKTLEEEMRKRRSDS